MRPIAVFYHCLFFLGTKDNPLPSAVPIVVEQMGMMKEYGLTDAASEIICGINGAAESELLADVILPAKAHKVYHGLQSQAENLTIVEIEKWVPSHPGWLVLYFHSKGATHSPGSAYGDGVSSPWRRTMMQYLVKDWRDCVADLERGYESVGCHFLTGMCDGSQNLWAGNFWWATSEFLATVPSIYLRDRIKQSGIANVESRYESEVWIGNGPRIPNVRQYLPRGGGGVP